MKLKKGDNVQIMIGKDRGKQGAIAKIDPVAGRVIIQGLNLFKKHRRPKKQGEKGEIISTPHSLDIANVRFVCSSCNKPTRLGHRLEKKNKMRYCKKCDQIV